MGKRRLDVILGGELSQSFDRAFKSANAKSKELSGQLRKLNKTSKNISSYKSLAESTKKAGYQWKAAKIYLDTLHKEMKQSDRVTKAQKRSFEAAKRAVDSAYGSYSRSRQELSHLRRTLNSAGVDTKDLAREQHRLAQAIDETTRAQSKLEAKARRKSARRQAMGDLKGKAVGSIATAAAISVPILSAARFEDQMASVKSIAKGSDTDFKKLEETIRGLGKSTRFNAMEIAAASEYLAMAGFNAKDAEDSLQNVLNLATATGTQIDASADIVSNIKSGFGLKVSDLTRLSDVLVSTTTTSNTNLTMLGETIKYVGTVASGLGSGVEEVSAMAGLLGDVGIQGSMAGTALRSVYQRLAAPPAEAKKALRAMRYNPKDGQSLKAVPQILSEIHEKLKPLGDVRRSQILKNLFGAEAVAGATELVKRAGSGDLDKKIELIASSHGIAAKVMEERSKTTAAAMDSLKSSISDIGIEVGSLFLPEVAAMARGLSSGVLAVSSFIKENKDLTKALGYSATGLVALKPLLLIGRLLKFTGAMKGASRMTGFFSKATKLLGLGLKMTPWGRILTIVTTIGTFGYDIYNNSEKFRKTIDQIMAKTKNWISSISWVKDLFGDGNKEVKVIQKTAIDKSNVLPLKIRGQQPVQNISLNMGRIDVSIGGVVSKDEAEDVGDAVAGKIRVAVREELRQAMNETQSNMMDFGT